MTLMNHWQEKYPTVPVSRKKQAVMTNVYPKNSDAAIHWGSIRFIGAPSTAEEGEGGNTDRIATRRAVGDFGERFKGSGDAFHLERDLT